MIAPGIPARFYDGETAAAHEARLHASHGQLWIKAPDGGTLARWPLGEVEPSGDWDGRGPFALASRSSPDARVLVATREGLAELRRMMPELQRAQGARRRRGATIVLGGAFAAALAVFFVFEVAPSWLGPLVPPSWLEPVGNATIDLLAADHPLCADGPGRQALQDLANRLAASRGHEDEIRVDILETSDVNAFAVPGDRIVVLQGLIRKADPDELAGVLAHEVGHVIERHAHESVVRGLGVQALLQIMTGGAGLDVAAVAAAVVQLSYSRAAEEEADRRAVEMLRSQGLRTAGLKRFFTRLEKLEGELGALKWLSTHPASRERALAIPDETGGREGFSKAQWLAIRSACG
ncbi:MAG TPA: M48 family metallopeptidase [Methylomirabilota bacterium]|nr:M48 family metallopeptidase [Methylomirabilota bacterium]